MKHRHEGALQSVTLAVNALFPAKYKILADEHLQRFLLSVTMVTDVVVEPHGSETKLCYPGVSVGCL